MIFETIKLKKNVDHSLRLMFIEEEIDEKRGVG